MAHTQILLIQVRDINLTDLADGVLLQYVADDAEWQCINGFVWFAPASEGVTNGDSHDHSGGDGAQINHVNLSSIGSNSHATIDSVIGTGWIPVSQTWTYASADDPVYQIYVSGDVTANADYKLGNKVKCTNNSTTFYGFIVKVGSYDSGNNRTPVDIYGGTDYDLANSSITAPYISKVKSPDGFTLDPAKWTVETTDASQRDQATPTQNTWYNTGSISITIPIGKWNVCYEVLAQAIKDTSSATIASIYVTLSTANNSEVDKKWTTVLFKVDAATTAAIQTFASLHRENLISLTTKTTHYLNHKTDQSNAAHIEFRGDLATTVIRARCAYL